MSGLSGQLLTAASPIFPSVLCVLNILLCGSRKRRLGKGAAAGRRSWDLIEQVRQWGEASDLRAFLEGEWVCECVYVCVCERVCESECV